MIKKEALKHKLLNNELILFLFIVFVIVLAASVYPLSQQEPETAVTQTPDVADKLAYAVDEQVVHAFEEDHLEFTGLEEEPLASAKRTKFAIINVIRTLFILTFVFLFIELAIIIHKWIKIRANPLEKYVVMAKSMDMKKKHITQMLQKKGYKKVTPLVDKIYRELDRPLLITGVIVVFASIGSLAALSFLMTYDEQDLKYLLIIIMIIGFIFTVLSKAIPVMFLEKKKKTKKTL